MNNMQQFININKRFYSDTVTEFVNKKSKKMSKIQGKYIKFDKTMSS